MYRKRVMQVRLTESQYERALLRKESLGYKTLSQFLRDLLLKEDLATIKMLQDIHRKLIGEDRNGKNKTGLQG
tara:strand:+ start:550 stop:768 length:219 start_codon:yes stop_codon:yes gene_type:complete